MPSAQAREILIPSMLVDAAVAREALEPERGALPGDVVRFGSVDCLLCTASTFWACLRSPAPRTATLASVRPRPVSNRPLETD